MICGRCGIEIGEEPEDHSGILVAHKPMLRCVQALVKKVTDAEKRAREAEGKAKCEPTAPCDCCEQWLEKVTDVEKRDTHYREALEWIGSVDSVGSRRQSAQRALSGKWDGPPKECTDERKTARRIAETPPHVSGSVLPEEHREGQERRSPKECSEIGPHPDDEDPDTRRLQRQQEAEDGHHTPLD